MECKNIKPLLIDFADKKLNIEQTSMVQQHLLKCKSCTEELDELSTVMNELNQIKDEQPSKNLRAKFMQNLQQEKTNLSIQKTVASQLEQSKKSRTLSPFMQIAAGFAILISGVLIGLVANKPNNQNQIASMQTEINGLKQMVMLSKIDQQSPSARIQAVSFANDMQQSDPEVIKALISAMNTDENVNVRLAATTALAKFAEEDFVRASLIESLPNQSDPFVQITLINIMIQLNEKRASNYLQQIVNNKETNKTVRSLANKGLDILT